MALSQLRMRVSLAAVLTCLPLAGQADLYSLKIENDVFASDDGHYTNGFELMRSFKPDADHWSRRFAGAMPGWGAEEVDNVAYRLGHQLYTPDNIRRAELIEDDRPYAALLFAGISIFSDDQHDGWRGASGLHLDVGIVGPAAGGEKIQRRVHEITNSDEPRGWDNQLRNEPFVNLAYQYRGWLQHSLGGLEFEYGPSAGFSLGNLYTYGSVGLGLRVGQGLGRSFSIPAVAPVQSGSMFFDQGGGFAWSLFADVEGRYMAQNMLLEGNTFKSSHSVDPNEWVGDAKAGIALTFDNWQLAFARVWRTREFNGQNEHDEFGSLTASIWF